MNSITDDELGALLARDLRRRTVDVPSIDLDAIVRAGHRTVLRRNAIVTAAMAGVFAMTAWVAVSSVDAQGTRTVGVTPPPAGLSRSSAPATVVPTRSTPSVQAPESEAATARRLTRGLRELLQEKNIHVLGSQPVVLARQYNMPAGYFQTDFTIDRAPDGDGGIGLFVTVQRASVARSQRLPLQCTAFDQQDLRSCTNDTLPDGTLLKTMTTRDDKGHSIGSAAIARQKDGDVVAVGIMGDAYHRWPTGVNMSVLHQMVESPLLNP